MMDVVVIHNLSELFTEGFRDDHPSFSVVWKDAGLIEKINAVMQYELTGRMSEIELCIADARQRYARRPAITPETPKWLDLEEWWSELMLAAAAFDVWKAR